MADRDNFWTRYTAIEDKLKKNISKQDVEIAFNNLFSSMFFDMSIIQTLPMNLKYDFLDIMREELHFYKAMEKFFIKHRNHLIENNTFDGYGKYRILHEFYYDGCGDFSVFDHYLEVLEKSLE